MGLAAPAIATSLNVFQPASFCQARNGDMFIVNGVDRPRRWDGSSTLVQLAGLTAPTVALTVTASSGGNATAGAYVIYFRYKSADGIYSKLSPVATVTATANQKFDYSSVTASSEARVTEKEIYRSTAGQSITVYKVATITNAATTSANDTYSDTALEALAKLTVAASETVSLDETAARHGVPPDFKAVMVMFQDRYFYGVDVAYTEGTVTVTNGSTTVTGASTNWTSQMAGRYLYVLGAPAGYLISTASASSITLSENYGGTTGSGKTYAVRPAPAERNVLYYSATDEPESVPSTNTVPLQENTADTDEVTGLIPMGGFLLVMKERHHQRLTFVSQPAADVNVMPLAYRGCLNQRTWCQAEGTFYMLDQFGIYAFAGSPRPLSEPIQDIFRDDIDWSKAKWFSAHSNCLEEYIEFLVAFSGDSGTRPTRGLRYYYRTQSWQTITYQWEMGGAAVVAISGKARLVLGGEDDWLYLKDEGTLDGIDSTTVSGTIRGTVTSATSTTLVDPTATFPSGLTENIPIVIYDGTGKMQVRRISSRDSATQVSVSAAWTTTPDGTSKYQIGGIKWNWKSGLFKLVHVEQDNQRAIRVNYQPTTGAHAFDIRRYVNHATSPVNNEQTYDLGSGITIKDDDPDWVVDTKLTRVDESDQPGFVHVAADGSLIDETLTDRWNAVELRGVQNTDNFVVYGVELTGVDGPG